MRILWLAFCPLPTIMPATTMSSIANCLLRRKQYPDSIAPYVNHLLLVGINYDRNTKQHTCRIEN